MPFALVTPAEDEPVSLEEAKASLRVDHEFEDDLIERLVAAARELLEEVTARQYMPADWTLSLDRFPCGTAARPHPLGRSRYGLPWRPIEIRKPPVTEVAITYFDVDGNEQTLSEDAYFVDLVSTPPRIIPAPGLGWPATQLGRPNAVTVAFTAGYEDADAVPQRAKQAILLLVGHWFANREATGTIGKEIELAWESLVESLQYTAIANAGADDE